MKKMILVTILFLFAGGHKAFAETIQWNSQSTYKIGTFAPVGQKHTEGDLEIEQRPDGLYLAFAQNFKTQEGPDLRVVVRDSTGNTQMIILEPLKSFQGEQEYKLPMSTDELMSFDQVVIYCAKFHVDFGVAELQ